MANALLELEEYLQNQIAESNRSIQLYQESLTRCIELRDGLQKSLDALRINQRLIREELANTIEELKRDGRLT